MRTLATLLLLCLALAGVSERVCPVDGEACATGTDVLSVQAPGDEPADDHPWDVAEPLLTEDRPGSSRPDPAPSRHTPLLNDQRRYRPPRA